MQALNWDDLRYFLALAREQRVSAAGRALGVKHTTVARRVEALEAHLGARLFDQTQQGYALTQAGENLMEHALAIEERALAVDREIVGMDTQLEGPLRLTAPHGALPILVVPYLHRLLDAYPKIEIDLIGTTGLLDLAARQADIALRMTASPPDYLVGRKVLPMRHGVYASTGYLRKARERQSVVLFSGDDPKPAWVAQHFPDADIALRADDAGVVLSAVRAHRGLARLPCFVADNQTDLRRIDMELTPSPWGVWVLSHVDLRDTARVRVCREFLIDILLEQRALVEGTASNYGQLRAK
jgi:DNA-binding transcriptional LysR family regulator